MHELSDLRTRNQELINENTQLKTILKMKENTQPSTVINVAGNYIDIHNNQHCTIYATEPDEEQQTSPQAQGTTEEPYKMPIPREADYNGVRLYIEERKKYDAQFKEFCIHHNRRQLCELLTREFGWFVDDKSLGKNISRNI